MNRIIKFRGKRIDNGEWVYGCLTYNFDPHNEKDVVVEAWIREPLRNIASAFPVIPESVGQFTGLLDKNGNEIYEGDIIRYCRPYRSTQTHTGDNIPNGSYTEPMEPEIKVIEDEVIFADGVFCLREDYEKDKTMAAPLKWCICEYDEEQLKQACGWQGKDLFDWNDPTDGEIAYLLETYKKKDLQELLEWISGIEIIGNIYETPELLNQPTV